MRQPTAPAHLDGETVRNSCVIASSPRYLSIYFVSCYYLSTLLLMHLDSPQLLPCRLQLLAQREGVQHHRVPLVLQRFEDGWDAGGARWLRLSHGRYCGWRERGSRREEGGRRVGGREGGREGGKGGREREREEWKRERRKDKEGREGGRGRGGERGRARKERKMEKGRAQDQDD